MFVCKKEKVNVKELNAGPHTPKEEKACLQVVNISILGGNNDMILKQLALFAWNREV